MLGEEKLFIFEKSKSKQKNMRKKKMYISLPITGKDEQQQRSRAIELKNEFTNKGYEVVTPFEIVGSQQLSYAEMMKLDLKELLTCDSMLLAEGWNESLGCNCEYAVAVACNLELIMLEPYINRDNK